MRVYPLALVNLERHRCVVVGGGPVAARKVEGLLECGAHPLVISPTLCPDLEGLADAARIAVIRRAYGEGDLLGATLVIAATDDPRVNERVHCEAQRVGALVNVVDAPELCDVYMPAVVRRGDLTIAISTGGGSPAFARHMREQIEALIDPAYGELLDLLSALRPRILAEPSRAQQRAIWSRLLDGRLLEIVRQEGLVAARAWAQRMLEGFQTDNR